MAETYTVEKLADEPIIVTTMTPKYSVGRNMTDSDNEIRDILDVSDEDLFVIADISQVTLTFNDVMLGSSKGARNQAALWHHPKIKKMIFISQAAIVGIAAKGLKSKFFGHLEVMVFPSTQAALDYCRSQDAIKV